MKIQSIIVRNFYDNPDGVRKMAVSAKWWPFPIRYLTGRPSWYISMERNTEAVPGGKCSFKRGTVYRTDWHKDVFNDFLGEYDEEIDDEKRKKVLATAYLMIGEVDKALELLNDK